MWGDEGSGKTGNPVLFLFDAAYAADPYRVHSIVSGALPQIACYAGRVHVFCEGGYRGPSFRGSTPRVVVHNAPRNRFSRRRSSEHLGLTESAARWISNVTPKLEPLLDCFASYRGFHGVIAFSAGLQFPNTAFRLAHIFASDTMPLLLGVTPAKTAHREDLENAAWLGAELLCDGALAAATGESTPLPQRTERASHAAGGGWREQTPIAFMEDTPLRFTHAATYPATSLETCPAVHWDDYLRHGARPRPAARDVVMFVRPDWDNCGSGTTFRSLARYFRSNGALLIDIAIWPYASPPHAGDNAIDSTARQIAEEQKDIGAALYFSVRRSAAVPRLAAELGKMLLTLPPTTIVRQKLLQYALAARPAILRKAISRARISHVYVNHFFTYQYANPLIDGRRFFLDTHDIQSINWVQGGAINTLTGKGDHFHTLLRDELRILAKADRLCFVNTDECMLAQSAIPADRLDVIIALPQIAPCAQTTLGDPARLLIVASRNQPNRRSLEWFLRSVWPLILATYQRRMAPADLPVLDICGSIALDFPDANVPSCRFHGPVADLRSFYAAADVVLLPVVIGSGVAIKTIEAVLHGRPVVATRHALRGLPDAVVQSIGYANEPADFAAAVVKSMTSQAEQNAAAARVAKAAELIRRQGYYDRLDAAMEAVRLPTILKGPGFTGSRPPDAADDAVIGQIVHALERYFVARDNASDLIANPARIQFDSDPSWLAPIFARQAVHDEDYRIFGHFHDLRSLVLDIGANYGYSVASMFAAGCGSCVLSFEPVAPLAACLAEVVRLNPGRCDYRMAALGAGEGSQTFVMPVINNRGITALTTADKRPHLESLARSIYRHKIEHMHQEAFESLTFYSFTAPVQALDTALRNAGPFGVPISSIVAAKIDTEGTEAAILAGARDTLAAHRPLILIEGANRQASVRDILHGAGYAFANRNGDRLALSDDISMRPNGFFVHATRLAEYQACGLLCAS